eukprot:6207603-Pleurochrysis_carterae.AAC.1
MQDPQIRFIRESCTASKRDQEKWSRQRMRMALEHALTYVLDLNAYGFLVHRLTKYGPRVLVPRQHARVRVQLSYEKRIYAEIACRALHGLH